MQTEIDFTRSHTHDTGIENNAILQANRKKFNRQCQTIFDAMMRGERLTSITCVERYRIVDFRRRCSELVASGVEISERILDGGYKEKWMSDEQKIVNKKFLHQQTF